jgi:hypothetical protein
MKAIADVIVVDTAPVTAVSDAMTMALVSDLVMLVADVRCTSRRAVSAAAQEIGGTGPRIVVGVLNGVPASGNRQVRFGATHELPPPASSGRLRPPASSGQLRPPASSAGVPAILAATVPLRVPNGHTRTVPNAGGPGGPGGNQAGDGPESRDDL